MSRVIEDRYRVAQRAPLPHEHPEPWRDVSAVEALNGLITMLKNWGYPVDDIPHSRLIRRPTRLMRLLLRCLGVKVR